MACKKQQGATAAGLPCHGILCPDFGHFILDHSEKRKATKTVKYPLANSREMLTPAMIYPEAMLVGPDAIHTYDLRTLKWSSRPRGEIKGAQVLAACSAMEGKLLLKLSLPYHGQSICFFSLETSTVTAIPPCLSIDPSDLKCTGYCNGIVIAIGTERNNQGSFMVEYFMDKQWSFLYRSNSKVETTIHSDMMAVCEGSLYAACADEKGRGYVLRIKCDCAKKDDGSGPVEWSLLSLPELNPKATQERATLTLSEDPIAIAACQGSLYCIQPYEEVFYLYKVFIEGPWREEKQRISVVYDPEVANAFPPLKGFRRVIGLGDLILFQLSNGEMWTYRVPDEPWPHIQTFHEVKSFPNSMQWALCAWSPSC